MVARNVNTNVDLLHMSSNEIRFPGKDNSYEDLHWTIKTVEDIFLCHRLSQMNAYLLLVILFVYKLLLFKIIRT